MHPGRTPLPGLTRTALRPDDTALMWLPRGPDLGTASLCPFSCHPSASIPCRYAASPFPSAAGRCCSCSRKPERVLTQLIKAQEAKAAFVFHKGNKVSQRKTSLLCVMHSEPSLSLPQMNTWPVGGNLGLTNLLSYLACFQVIFF